MCNKGNLDKIHFTGLRHVQWALECGLQDIHVDTNSICAKCKVELN